MSYTDNSSEVEDPNCNFWYLMGQNVNDPKLERTKGTLKKKNNKIKNKK